MERLPTGEWRKTQEFDRLVNRFQREFGSVQIAFEQKLVQAKQVIFCFWGEADVVLPHQLRGALLRLGKSTRELANHSIGGDVTARLPGLGRTSEPTGDKLLAQVAVLDASGHRVEHEA